MTSIADNTGSIQERYAYTAYGTPHILTRTFTPRSTSNHAWETPFAGYRWDSQIQLYHVRNRALRSAFNWLQRDSLGYFDAASLYSYVGNQPTVLIDPAGRYAVVDDLVAALAGCGITAGWSVVRSLLEGDKFWVAVCKAGVACAFGAFAGWAAEYFPSVSACFLGIASAVGTSLGQALCQPCPVDWECTLWGAFAVSVFGCLAGLGIEHSKLLEILKDIAGAGEGVLWEFDVYNVCRFFAGRPMLA